MLRHADAEFIAHAREDIPYLLTEITRLRDALARAIGLVESVADQQATPDDSYAAPLNDCRSVLADTTIATA